MWSYASYASCRATYELPFWLRPYGGVIAEDNDGMVPVSSAKWGKFRGIDARGSPGAYRMEPRSAQCQSEAAFRPSRFLERGHRSGDSWSRE